MEAEFCACMSAIEKAHELQLRDVWLESDSTVVVQAFSHNLNVPWRMRIRWENCKKLAQVIRCKCTHIYREANRAADEMANNAKGLAMNSSQWWNDSPSFLLPLLHRDSISLPYFRIV